jgi:hypothetical protein
MNALTIILVAPDDFQDAVDRASSNLHSTPLLGKVDFAGEHLCRRSVEPKDFRPATKRQYASPGLCLKLCGN